MSDPLAYFLTWHAYGTWLPGSALGSVNDKQCTYGTPLVPSDPAEVAHNAARLVHPPVTLDYPQRLAVQLAVVEVCDYRIWTLHALHVRTTHVHAVVSGPATPEKILVDFKAYATRRIRREGLEAADTHIWSVHGSTRYLWSIEHLTAAVEYTVNQQGVTLEPLPLRAFELSESGVSATGRVTRR